MQQLPWRSATGAYKYMVAMADVANSEGCGGDLVGKGFKRFEFFGTFGKHGQIRSTGRGGSSYHPPYFTA
jgi:hypothetical protein